MPDLHSIESWMLTAISHPVDIQAGMDLASYELPTVAYDRLIMESAEWSAVERLSVYWNAYFARLQECLRDQYALLVSLLGEEVFDEFANGYLRAYPSTSYTLGNLGNDLPRFLRETRPEKSSRSPDFADLLVELAEFELMVSQIFDGPGIEASANSRCASIVDIEPHQYACLHFEFAPCLKVKQFSFPVSEYCQQLREQTQPISLKPRRTWLALTRENYVVRHYALGRAEFHLLASLLSGNALGKAIENCCSMSSSISAQIQRHIGSWFCRWTERNWITGWRLRDVESQYG